MLIKKKKGVISSVEKLTTGQYKVSLSLELSNYLILGLQGGNISYLTSIEVEAVYDSYFTVNTTVESNGHKNMYNSKIISLIVI